MPDNQLMRSLQRLGHYHGFMTTLDAKLQIKAGKTVAILGDGPALSLDAAPAASESADAVLAFAKNKAELTSRLDLLAAAVGRGAMAWVAYPKARQLGTDLNRDVIRDIVPAAGLDPVRQISVDDVWSALRLKALT